MLYHVTTNGGTPLVPRACSLADAQLAVLQHRDHHPVYVKAATPDDDTFGWMVGWFGSDHPPTVTWVGDDSYPEEAWPDFVQQLTTAVARAIPT